MPELVPTWERLVELAGGGDMAARMLSLWDPPPLVTGCSQAVLTRDEPLLVRNYDFDPELLEGVIARTELTGRPVLGMSDCLWGLLDGINDAGLSMSLAFGGRRATGPGFAMPLVVRYLLELCVDDRARRRGARAAAGAGVLQPHDHRSRGRRRHRARRSRPARRRSAARWSPPTTSAGRVARARRGRPHRGARAAHPRPARNGPGEEAFVAAFLEPPLHSTGFADGFGTLYTAVLPPGPRRSTTAGRTSAGVSPSTRSRPGSAPSGCPLRTGRARAPRRAGPGELRLARGRVIRGGVERPEPCRVLRAAQRRLQERAR